MNKKISYQDWRELNPIQIAKMLEKYPENWWGYITALRGPDVENSFESPFREIKILFSGFLRALTDEIPDIKWFEELMNKLSKDEKEFKRIVKGIPKIPAHYYEHCYDAFYVIRNYLELTPKFAELSEALSYLAYEARAGRKGKIPQALKNVIEAYHEAKEEKHEG